MKNDEGIAKFVRKVATFDVPFRAGRTALYRLELALAVIPLEKRWADSLSSPPVLIDGLYVADRFSNDGPLDIRHELIWTPDGSHVFSLAYGTDLHGFSFPSPVDWELYVFRWPGEGPGDICCHASFWEAMACARRAIETDRWGCDD